MRKPDNSAHYYFVDQIGSANIVTNATGVMPPEQDIEYHPYGEQQVYIDTSGQEYRFTGHEHDTETNDDYFGARYYSSSFGRFLTPDWSATPVPIPYAVMGNPQTLNLYAYVENNPITGTDPDGHGFSCPTEKGCAGGNGTMDGSAAEVGADYGSSLAFLEFMPPLPPQNTKSTPAAQNQSVVANYDPNKPLYTPHGVVYGNPRDPSNPGSALIDNPI